MSCMNIQTRGAIGFPSPGLFIGLVLSYIRKVSLGFADSKEAVLGKLRLIRARKQILLPRILFGVEKCSRRRIRIGSDEVPAAVCKRCVYHTSYHRMRVLRRGKLRKISRKGKEGRQELSLSRSPETVKMVRNKTVCIVEWYNIYSAMLARTLANTTLHARQTHINES